MLDSENIKEESEENYRIKLEPLEEIYDSEECKVSLENGQTFTYKFHSTKNKSEESSHNLVIFIPGAEHNGENHLKEISQRTKHAFDSITFDYPQPFSIDNVSEGLKKIMSENSSTKIVLQGSSYGGAVLHRVMEQIDTSQLDNIAGVIYECSTISRDNLSSLARYVTDPSKKWRLQAAAAIRKPKYYGEVTPTETENSDNLLEMIHQLSESISPAPGNYPRRALLFDKDKLVDNDSLVSTLAKESGADAKDIGIVVESNKNDKWGHSPQSWSKVHHINAQLVDEFLN